MLSPESTKSAGEDDVPLLLALDAFLGRWRFATVLLLLLLLLTLLLLLPNDSACFI